MIPRIGDAPQPIHIFPEPLTRDIVYSKAEGRPSPPLRWAQSTSCRHGHRATQSHRRTGQLKRKTVSRNDLGYDLQTITGRQSSFVITPFSTTFSNDKSAYIRLRQLLSRSSFFCQLTSDASSPLYIDDRIPYYYQISLIRRPASASFNIGTIGSPVNVDCRIELDWLG